MLNSPRRLDIKAGGEVYVQSQSAYLVPRTSRGVYDINLFSMQVRLQIDKSSPSRCPDMIPNAVVGLALAYP